VSANLSRHQPAKWASDGNIEKDVMSLEHRLVEMIHFPIPNYDKPESLKAL
jgi:hypothetical protein